MAERPIGEVYVWNEMDAGNWEAPRGKGTFDIYCPNLKIDAQQSKLKLLRDTPTYLSSSLSSCYVLAVTHYSTPRRSNTNGNPAKMWRFPMNKSLPITTCSLFSLMRSLHKHERNPRTEFAAEAPALARSWLCRRRGLNSKEWLHKPD